MTHLELREKFLSFWQEAPRNHIKIPSSSLVPENDPTTLFTGSGMQPLIPYLLGAPHPEGSRLVDIQKCFRGQDIESVGDNRHDTFFEMMGNWSLGEYFKKDQLAWYLEFLTEILGLPKDRLFVSCFQGISGIEKDMESAEIWKSLGIPKERISFYGVEHNWWSRSGSPDQMPISEIGGPDSEVYFEFEIPHNKKYGEKCHPACDCGKYLEIGNSVFIQYQKQSDGSFKELSQKNVDFGGGIERALMAINDKPDLFQTDVFSNIIRRIENISGLKYEGENKLSQYFRVTADHIRAATFIISAGVIPSNVDRGYILRRLIRRTIRSARFLNINDNFLSEVCDAVIETYREVYPEIQTNRSLIHNIISNEETKFRLTLEKGLKEFEKISTKGNISPQDTFYLYESFGFPYELTEEEARTKGITIASKEEFAAAFKNHQEQSRSADQRKFKGGLADHSDQVVKYHTATHLLHAALRQVLGEHVHQEGSNITAERLRFDFSHPTKLTPEEITKVENLVNENITADLPRKVETMSYDAAIKSGALAFFKERYPEKVTVYSFGHFSREICGGPHVEHTNILGKFKIIKEESVAAGVRRIYGQISEH